MDLSVSCGDIISLITSLETTTLHILFLHRVFCRHRLSLTMGAANKSPEKKEFPPLDPHS